MKNILTRVLIFSVSLAFFASCANDELTSLYGNQTDQPGKVVIIGYSALNDSIQITVNGKPVELKDISSFYTLEIYKSGF